MIPQFNHNNVLPPYTGDPGRFSNLSPYECTTVELCERFSFSKERIELLKKFINFRIDLRATGLAGDCFQWVDGSFVEDKEALVGSPPNDIDVLTFIRGYSYADLVNAISSFPYLNDRDITKLKYKLDHFPIFLELDAMESYHLVKCFTMLFNHSRHDDVWKGILQVRLNTPFEDTDALTLLNSK